MSTKNKKAPKNETSHRTHNATLTSIWSYKEIKELGIDLKQNQIVINAINSFQPINSRQLAETTGLERSSVVRAINDLLKKHPSIIKKAEIKPCKETRKAVTYYSLIDWPQKSLF